MIFNGDSAYSMKKLEDIEKSFISPLRDMILRKKVLI
jgi:hypothetical protein